MAEETLLSDDFLRQLMNVGEVDIVVGLSTHNDAKTIGPVVRAIQAGILKCFPRERVAIINADGGSQDGTPDLVTGASIDDMWHQSKVYALRTLHAISTQYGRSPDPAAALRTILTASDLLRARACALISADATTIEPDWLQRLIKPIYEDNFDLVCPIYRRRRFEGVLMRNVLYPMVRATYGFRVREPYGSEVAISGRLAADFLGKDIWNEDAGRMGPEISLTIAALTGKYRVGQSFVGTKILATRSSDLVGAMRRTVGALFSSLDSNFSEWSKITASEAIPTFGPQPEVAAGIVRVNRKRLREMFVAGVAQLEPVLRSILSASTLAGLQKIAATDGNDFNYSDELWAKTIFEFAASYHKSVINRDHILQALIPLYRGRSLTFVLQNRNGSVEELEGREESLCAEFERMKPYLLEIWAEKK